MRTPLKLMCVLAHPGDESLAVGGTLAKYAAAGVLTTLLLATRGERGRPCAPAREPDPGSLSRIREAEVRAAAGVLGITDLAFLGYVDGTVAHIDPRVATSRIVTEIRVARPDVVVTFGPDGGDGHPDRLAISWLTTAAVARAAEPAFDDGFGTAPHQVAKLYFRIWPDDERARPAAVPGAGVIVVNGERLSRVSGPGETGFARIDTTAYRTTVARAIACHKSRIGDIDAPWQAAAQEGPRDTQHFCRALSTVESSASEDDLFAGLRQGPRPATAKALRTADPRAVGGTVGDAVAVLLGATAGWGR